LFASPEGKSFNGYIPMRLAGVPRDMQALETQK
jgi:hypothetical protein